MEFLGIFLSRKRHGKKKKHSRSFVSAWFSVSGKRDSNPRPPAWKASALSTELFPRYVGRAGFEPTKTMSAELQSAPVGHFGISPLFKEQLFRVQIYSFLVLAQ